MADPDDGSVTVLGQLEFDLAGTGWCRVTPASQPQLTTNRSGADTSITSPRAMSPLR
jgi:hypothetical protein